MGNVGSLNFIAKNVESQPAIDPNTRIDVTRTNGDRILRFSNLALPATGALQIPAFPQESNLFCDVTPKRYRPFFTDFFTLSSATPRTLEPNMLRQPNQWTARFDSWNQLPAAGFTALKMVLENSDVRVINGDNLGKFIKEIYDSATAAKTVLAKTSLLNLHAKLTVLPEPVGGQRPWFSFVQKILAIDRERFYALVDPQMGTIVERIRKNPGPFEIYKKAKADNHFDKLQKTLVDYRIFKSKMFSVKTTDQHGNLQLTIAPAKDSADNDVVLLDVDIDENGDLLGHLFDAFLVHPFTGGTHPFDIHEYMVLAHRDQALGYELI